MASGDGPGAEFNDPERLSLLKELDTALHSELSSTAWACLWLSDIEKLKVLVGHIQNDPCSYEIFFPTRVLLSIVRRCKLVGLHRLMQSNLFQSYRDHAVFISSVEAAIQIRASAIVFRKVTSFGAQIGRYISAGS